MSTTEDERKECRTCKYFEKKNASRGTCHRRCPQIYIYKCFEYGDEVERATSTFPTVAISEWCGEYQEKKS